MVERRVLAGAADVTPGRLRARLQRAVIAVDPSGAERRRKASEADRRIECHDTGNGTAVLGGAHLPAGPAIAADNRLHAIAKALKTDGDTRTLGQLSADVFLALLLGTHPGSGLPTTELTRAFTRSIRPSTSAARVNGSRSVSVRARSGCASAERGEIASASPTSAEANSAAREEPDPRRRASSATAASSPACAHDA